MEGLVIQPTFHAVAVNATEMQEASHNIRQWLQVKVSELTVEINEHQANLDSALKHKWKASPFRSMLSRTKQKHLYYEKLLAAVDAGFTIVPNMDVDVFAIRVKSDGPRQKEVVRTEKWAPHVSMPDEVEQQLRIGEGRYESPSQTVRTERSEGKNEKNETVHTAIMRVVDFAEMEFPLAIAHSKVMDATSAAMALKIFDRIGIVPRSGSGDPIVLGQITRKVGYTTKIASFLIAWYLDVRTL